MRTREIYYHDLHWFFKPFFRVFGCWGIQGNVLRCRWGELSNSMGFGLGYSVYHESATINLHLIWPGLYIKVPMIINQRSGTEDWCARYGLSWFENSIHFDWRDKTKIINMPWQWKHVRHTYLRPNGAVYDQESGQCLYHDIPTEIKEVYDYYYLLMCGEVQKRKATIYGEEREWRRFTWLPYPRKISRSINVSFDGEVGEGTGSWKGGTVGCGWEWQRGESMEQALQRMQDERRFRR